jgi:branched-chain amino acid transport system permease protein
MDIVVIISAIVYASILSLLSTGFTLVYLTAKIPNFAHGSFATIGIYISFTAVYVLGVNPYLFAPVAFILTGTTALLIYLSVLGLLRKRGASLISQMISLLAVEMIISAVLNIYLDYIQFTEGIYSRSLLLRYIDFNCLGLPGILIVSTTVALTLILSIHLMLTRTKFGISMRATVEDSSLAAILGVNINLVTSISWFLTGGLAGLAGSLMPMWFQGDPQIGYRILVSVFAASVLGGLSSIYGAILGGYIIGLTEILGTAFLSDVIGTWVTSYRLLIPLLVMCFTLLLMPRGVVGIIESLRMRRYKLSR